MNGVELLAWLVPIGAGLYFLGIEYFDRKARRNDDHDTTE